MCTSKSAGISVHPGNATCCPGGSAEAACVPTLTITPSSITTTGCSTHSEGVSSRFAVTTLRITTETTAKRTLAPAARLRPCPQRKTGAAAPVLRRLSLQSLLLRRARPGRNRHCHPGRLFCLPSNPRAPALRDALLLPEPPG